MVRSHTGVGGLDAGSRNARNPAWNIVERGRILSCRSEDCGELHGRAVRCVTTFEHCPGRYIDSLGITPESRCKQGLDGGSTSYPPKRVYAMGNFSKFLRPDYVRVDITDVPSAVQIVPFWNPTDGTSAIVALNSGNSDQQVSFFVANLAAGAPISVSDVRFSSSLAAQSVTTFVAEP
jgi:hypothetical protein